MSTMVFWPYRPRRVEAEGTPFLETALTENHMATLVRRLHGGFVEVRRAQRFVAGDAVMGCLMETQGDRAEVKHKGVSNPKMPMR